MRLLVHAPNVSEQLSDGLGRPDYSYGFVLNHFRPVLEQVGEVVDITDPRTEVPRALSEARQSGQDCVFLSFAPPHACETGLACPTTSVFAWEFDTIPDHDWGGNPKNDWRTVLADHGRAITLSSHSRNVVRDTMGDDFPVEAIPTPIFERVVASRPLREGPRPATIAVPHTPVDSREYRFTPLTIEHDEPSGVSTGSGRSSISTSSSVPIATIGAIWWVSIPPRPSAAGHGSPSRGSCCRS